MCVIEYVCECLCACVHDVRMSEGNFCHQRTVCLPPPVRSTGGQVVLALEQYSKTQVTPMMRNVLATQTETEVAAPFVIREEAVRDALALFVRQFPIEVYGAAVTDREWRITSRKLQDEDMGACVCVCVCVCARARVCVCANGVVPSDDGLGCSLASI